MLFGGIGLKILVVDDEANIRNVIKEYAEFEGYEVEEAVDGMEAVSKCKDEDFDPVSFIEKYFTLKDLG